jgi:hypothetical protein
LWLAACGGTPDVRDPMSDAPMLSPARAGFLADRVAFSQKDPRWASDPLGQSGDTLASDGCVVTSVAMALGNLGFQTNPKDLNKRLMETGNYTPRGWLIWNGVSEVTGGKAQAHYYDTVSEPLIAQCLARGDYPLVRFILPNGRSHWAMVLGRSQNGFHMRDPLRTSRTPLVFPRDASAFKSLRCIGLADGRVSNVSYQADGA